MAITQTTMLRRNFDAPDEPPEIRYRLGVSRTPVRHDALCPSAMRWRADND